MVSFSLHKHASMMFCAALCGSAVGCSSGIDSSLEHRSCSKDGKCVAGYVCSTEFVCVRDNGGWEPVADGGETDVSSAKNDSGVNPAPSSSMSNAGSPAAMPPPKSGATNAGGAGADATDAAGSAAIAGASSGAGSNAAGSDAMAATDAGANAAGRDAMTASDAGPGAAGSDANAAGSGAAGQGGNTSVNNDVASLAALLALFGLDLSDLAAELNVDVGELATTTVKLTDLVGLGVSEAALGLLGFTADTLKLIGIDVSAVLGIDSDSDRNDQRDRSHEDHGDQGAHADAPRSQAD